MQLQGKALRVTIYFGDSDHYQGKALHMALLQYLKSEGTAGATVTRGLAGFGANSRIHTASIVDLSADLPIRLEWVDQPELVEQLLPTLQAMVGAGLITVEEVEVAQYAPKRRPDPLTQPVRDFMRRQVVSVTEDTPAAELIALLLRRGYLSLAVVDPDGRPLGIITDGDLVRRCGLSARLDLHPDLSIADLEAQLASLENQGYSARQLMTAPAITLPDSSTLGQVAAKMVSNDLKRLPLVDLAGKLVGWISRVDILRAILHYESIHTDFAEPQMAGSDMAQMLYRDVPTVSPDTNLEGILSALQANRRRRAVVIDHEQRVLGIITDGDLLCRSQAEGHPSLIDRLASLISGQPSPAPFTLPDVNETAADLMTSPVITITLETSLSEALQLMLSLGIKRLPVVDDQGRLLGLLGRAALLRGLLKEGSELSPE